jgi:hypothetical protein
MSMPSNAKTVVAAALLLAGAARLQSTTIVPIPDRILVDKAALVVVATIEHESRPILERPATDWTVAIERVLKGSSPTGRIVVRLPGGLAPNGLANFIVGTPAFAPGRRAILFLQTRPDGAFGLVDLIQGSFLHGSAGRRSVAHRDFSATRVLPRGGRTAAREPLRDFDRFANWIEDRASGVRRPPDYAFRPSRSEMQALIDAFTLYNVDGFNLRWTDFDAGSSVNWYSHTNPLPGLTGGGASEVQRAIAVLNNEPTTPIQFAYAGTNAATGGTDTYDSLNVVLWNDPNQEMPGTFDCASGGTVAHASPWYLPSSISVFNGRQHRRIVGGDAVFNDGIECIKKRSPSFTEYIEHIVAHELGHTLGLLHSSEKSNEPSALLRNALMYYRGGDDGRGAVLNRDDVSALQTLYRPGGPTGGGGGGTGPAPSGCPAGTAADTLCLLKGRFHLTGTWQNQFDGSLGVLKPIVNSDLSGFFYFTDKSNVELIVKILDFGTEIKVFYSQLTNLKFNLSVKDTVTGKIKSYTNTPGDCGAIDPNFGGATAAAASLDSLPAAAGSCAASSSTLCLLDNRFAVSVDWRNQFNGASGTGRPKTLSRFTGAFAFDDPANLEILIKTLDFGDKTLVLYGSLSNFEYTLHVTDTLTGKTKDYRNAAGNYCGGLDGNF